jgi:hypothetical protein
LDSFRKRNCLSTLSERINLPLTRTNRDSEWVLTPWGSVLRPVDSLVLVPLLKWKAAIIQAKKYLQANISNDFYPWVSGYLDFARRVFWAVETYGYANAASHLSADVDLFVSWGFDLAILRNLAFLQGLSL